MWVCGTESTRPVVHGNGQHGRAAYGAVSQERAAGEVVLGEGVLNSGRESTAVRYTCALGEFQGARESSGISCHLQSLLCQAELSYVNGKSHHPEDGHQ
jgi:hypothetical protein